MHIQKLFPLHVKLPFNEITINDCLAPTVYVWSKPAYQEILGIAFPRHFLLRKVMQIKKNSLRVPTMLTV